MYVGMSFTHGDTFPLVLNLDTGKITPQYHVVFDNHFHTVDACATNPIDYDHDDWYRTFSLTESQYVPDYNPEFEKPPPVTESEGEKD